MLDSNTNTKVPNLSLSTLYKAACAGDAELQLTSVNGEPIWLISHFQEDGSWSPKESSPVQRELNFFPSENQTPTGPSTLYSEPTINSTSEKKNDTPTGVNSTDSDTESNNFRPVFSNDDRPVDMDTVIFYWPNALKALAGLNRQGNIQHYGNADRIRWKWKVSPNHIGKLLNHLMDAGTIDSDGIRHSTKVAWRALANLENELIKAGAVPGRYRIDDE
jgi:hypothetical protein